MIVLGYEIVMNMKKIKKDSFGLPCLRLGGNMGVKIDIYLFLLLNSLDRYNLEFVVLII